MRRRLTLLVAATTSVVLIAFLVPVAVLTGDVAQSSAVRRALAQSQALAAYAGSGDSAALQAAVGQIQSDGLGVTVFLADGTVLGDDRPRDMAVERTADTAGELIGSQTRVLRRDAIRGPDVTHSQITSRDSVEVAAVYIVELAVVVHYVRPSVV